MRERSRRCKASPARPCSALPGCLTDHSSLLLISSCQFGQRTQFINGHGCFRHRYRHSKCEVLRLRQIVGEYQAAQRDLSARSLADIENVRPDPSSRLKIATVNFDSEPLVIFVNAHFAWITEGWAYTFQNSSA